MKYPYFLAIILIIAMFPLPVFAADDTVEKTICKLAVGYQDVDEIKADLLVAVKREVINELFGEIIVASTAVENFVVTSDQIRASSIGFVRVDGNAEFYNGDSFVEACVTISAYVTEEDRAVFVPEKIEKKVCDSDDDLSTSQLITYVKDEVIIQAVVEFDPKLKGANREELLQLVQKVKYISNSFIPDTQTYCAEFEGYVVPIEIMAFQETQQSTTPEIAELEVTLGTFDQTRAGELSFDGPNWDEARQSLAKHFPDVVIESFPELSSETLEGVDILYLSSAASTTTAITPLTKTEQATLLEFIERGGCTILLLNNDGFASSADAANESLVEIFGLDMNGTKMGKEIATIVSSDVHPILNGSFGTIRSFTQNYPGGITNLGKYADALASNTLGSALVNIPKDAMGEGAGSVVVFSNMISFMDEDTYGLFSENEALFLNTIDYCVNIVMGSEN